MSDKLLAGIVTAAVIAPLCSVCVLGPAVIASVFSGVAAWFGGFDPVVTTALVLVAGLAVYGFIRKRGEKRALAAQPEEASQ